MRPAQIRVFDGLRLTTEHLDHMQNALRSSVEDLREIVGLGVVFRGFEVVANGDQAITVQPGLAFDFARNRLVRDEPLTLEVQIEAGAAQFVCLKYDRIEDGQIEEQFTLIYDSCSAVVQPVLPTAEDNLLALAIVSRADDGSLAITSLQPIEEEQEAAPATDEAGTEASAEPDTTNGALPGDSAPVPAPDAAPPAANGAPSATTNGSASVPTSDETNAPMPATDAAPSVATTITAPRWSVWQGVARLAGTNDTAVDLAALLVGPLRNRLAGTETSGGDLRLNLHQADIAVGGAVRTLTTHALLDATITPADTPLLHVAAQTEGEATFGGATVTQYGISTLRSRTGEDGAPLWTSDLTERGVAHLLLGGTAANAQPSVADDPLQHIQLVLRVDTGPTEGFKLVCDLVWVGDVNEALIDGLNATKPTLRWNATLAWKAWGM